MSDTPVDLIKARPCPFCGATYPDLYWDSVILDEREQRFVMCRVCGCEGPYQPDQFRAYHAWRVRPNLAPQPWRPVGLGLPDSDLEVMVCDEEKEVYPAYHNGEEWCDLDGIPLDYRVTHWMPYPDPPEL